MNNQRKKAPFMIGIAMIVLGFLAMTLSGQVDEQARQAVIFAGLVIFVLGFAAMVIYSLAVSSPKNGDEDPGSEKKPVEKSTVALWICTGLGFAGLLAMLAGFFLSEAVNYALVLPGIAVFLVGFSVVTSLLSKKFKQKMEEENQNNSNGDDKK